MTLGDRIAAEARTWVGTPFFPRQAVKGVGVDCVHLVLACYKAAGAVPENLNLPTDYNLDGGEHRTRSLVLDWLATCQFMQKKLVPEFRSIGDVVTFNFSKVTHHVGIMIDDHSFVHSIRNYGVVIGDMRAGWGKRLVSAWEPKFV